MNGLDIGLGVVLFFFVFRGIFRGFIKEATSIVAVVAAFFLASRYYPTLSEAARPFVQNPSYRDALGFLALFFGVFILVGLSGILLSMLFKMTISRTTDGLLGAVIALAKGLTLSAVVLMATQAFISPQSPFFANSQAWPYIHNFSEYLKNVVPPNLKDSLENKLQLIQPLLPGAGPDAGSTPGTELGPGEGQITSPDVAPDSGQQPPPWQPVPQEGGGDAPPAWPGSEEESSNP